MNNYKADLPNYPSLSHSLSMIVRGAALEMMLDVKVVNIIVTPYLPLTSPISNHSTESLRRLAAKYGSILTIQDAGIKAENTTC